ncbi:DNA polymerase III subunit chi [Spongiibacter taiwanensis]|uniref:DNA polymerase III subunit chi n=1 Tax=Spongiibacter taiwanensis TaxID=1748242 RepID=UPI0020354693|nr:DNA polymerase III subunit chi [Spongiibacter taiwanensis]USA42911.1 DNA polymerase III subunit chi [Spongiibacter taiwanensis]
MTRVDFYILDSSDPDEVLRYCCRLVDKAYRQGHRICIVASDEPQLKRLDDMLWMVRPESFLPHSEDTGDQVTLCLGDQVGDHCDVLINLTPGVPATFSRFERLAEIVCQEAQRLAASRERYSYYKHRGYPLHTHPIAA